MLSTAIHGICAAAFWIAAILLFYTFAGYPLLMALLAKASPRASRRGADAWPTITVMVVAHNEARRIVGRIENLLASDYPPEKLGILVVSDGSTDDTVALVEGMANPRVRVIAAAARSGKAAGLNTGLAACSSEVVVFADARQTFAPDAIRRLASWFSDPAFGAVSGELEIASAQSATGEGVGAYWKLEKRLRRWESVTDSCIGCTGAIYAIRRTLFQPIPKDTTLDDVVIPMQVVLAGYRVGHDPDARAYDPQALEPANESHRKSRTLAGNFQMLFRHPGWLLPWRNRLWLRLIAHKYLRLAAPLLLLILLAASALLRSETFYLAALLLQVGFYLLAAIGMATHLRIKLFSIPAGFVFLNATVVRAFVKYLFGNEQDRWKVARA